MIVEKLTPAIGAEIRNVDLSLSIDESRQNKIYNELIEHKIIIFRNQNLCAQKQLNFAKNFGTIDRPHSVYPHVDALTQVTLLENDGDRPPDTNAWHTDLTYYPSPPFASILYAQEIPKSGGDTLWASMYAAYDALPVNVQTELESLEAIHDPGSFRNQFLGANKNVTSLNKSMSEVGSAIHSVVKVHPVTGKKFLYVNKSFTNQIYGYSSGDSTRLLNYLFDHINQPEFQMRHRWVKGDVVMWDNRVTQHYAVADYSPQYRRMHRVTVVDDRRVV